MTQGSVVTVTEWDTLWRHESLLAGRTHVIAVDPPYRREHVAVLESAVRGGVDLHLYYGGDERQNTAKLLRYLVHPRFAMVCTYRALELLNAGETEQNNADVLVRAAVLAWEEAGVLLRKETLERALSILRELRLDRASPGEAKLEARNIPAYVEAEADYEECSRLCQTL